jgi:hypothetical protein
MKKTLAPLLALALLFGLALTVVATESAADSKAMSCTIKNVDIASNTVTVANLQAKEATYNVDQTTKITIGGKAGSLGDLKVGQPVKLKVNGTTALSIEA